MVLERVPRHEEHAQCLGHPGLRLAEAGPGHTELGQHLLLDRRAGHHLDYVARKARKRACATGAHMRDGIPGAGVTERPWAFAPITPAGVDLGPAPAR